MSTVRIKLSAEQMKFIALFENVTGATASDCILDPDYDRIIFLAKPGEMGLAIGKGGKNINMLRKMVGRTVEVVEAGNNAQELIRNSLAPASIKDIRVTEGPERKIAVVEVEPKDKAMAIGKNGRTIDKTRLLAKRYFQIDHVQIT
jgi:N utilization substance protein A